jgi:hypothetical protein
MSYEPESPLPDTEVARAKTNIPSILLIIAGVLNILGGGYFVVNGAVNLLNPGEVRKMQESINPKQAE